jgi:hypothetical protein
VHTGVFKMVMTYSLYILLHFKFSNGTARNMVRILLCLHSPRQTNSSAHRTQTGWGRVNILTQNILIKPDFENNKIKCTSFFVAGKSVKLTLFRYITFHIRVQKSETAESESMEHSHRNVYIFHTQCSCLCITFSC